MKRNCFASGTTAKGAEGEKIRITRAAGREHNNLFGKLFRMHFKLSNE